MELEGGIPQADMPMFPASQRRYSLGMCRVYYSPLLALRASGAKGSRQSRQIPQTGSDEADLCKNARHGHQSKPW